MGSSLLWLLSFEGLCATGSTSTIIGGVEAHGVFLIVPSHAGVMSYNLCVNTPRVALSLITHIKTAAVSRQFGRRSVYFLHDPGKQGSYISCAPVSRVSRQISTMLSS
jgi:hypothetical protein